MNKNFKWLLIFSLYIFTESSFQRDKYKREVLERIANRLKSVKRDYYPIKRRYDQHEEYNRYNDDIDHRELVIRPYEDLHSRTYHQQQNLDNLLDETDNSVVKDRSNEEINIQMPNIQPKEPDTYMCYGYKLPTKDSYLVKFIPLAEQQIAHHMLLFGCEEPFIRNEPWECREMKPVCKTGTQRIMYAWGKNAPPLEMPKDVGVHVGGKSGINYLVVQVHYLDVSSFKEGHTDASGVKATLSVVKPQNFAGIYVLADGYHSIPPHKKKVHMNMACSYRGGGNDFSKQLPTIYPFRFRVHTHTLGTVVTGYRVRDGEWTLIGKGDPQKPQAFYKVFNNVDIKDGDEVYARCTFNSMNRAKTTYLGATHHDEMCNFYIMYFYDSNAYHPPMLPCGYIDPDSDNLIFPAGSDTPLISMKNKPV